MKKSLIVTCILLLFSLNASANEMIWMVGGVHYGGMTGQGMGENEFDRGVGLFFEFPGFIYNNGWSWLFWGTNVYWAKNNVYDSSKKVKFYMPYFTEIRKFALNQKFLKIRHNPFFSFGIGWNRMHFEDTEGSDNQAVYSAGIGTQILLSSQKSLDEPILQIHFRIYAVTGNSIEQTKGFELQVGIGIIGG